MQYQRAMSCIMVLVSFMGGFRVVNPLSVKAAETAEAPTQADDWDEAIRFPVERYELKNGLTVLLAPDRSAPLISYQTWFRVGSKDEKPGATGLAHLFEHMMFRGAKRFGPGEMDRLVSSNGGSLNAFTTRDSTAYYLILPAGKLELAVDLESDRLESLVVNETNFFAEREVVKEERRLRVEDDVVGQLFEQIFETVFKSHPYRWPVVGYMKDLEKMPTDSVRDFHSRFYVPANAIVVIAGDFDVSSAKRLIEKYYGRIPGKPRPVEEIALEPYAKFERHAQVRKRVESEYYTLSFLTPSAGHEDGYALDLLGNILGHGTSSRLYRRLVYEAQLATGVNTGLSSLQQHGVFHVFVTLRRGASVKEVQKIVLGEIWSARNKLYQEGELKKARTQVIKSYVDSLKTIHGKASALGLNETLLGSYQHLFKDLGRYRAVTPLRIQQVANLYLTPNRRTAVIVRPEASGGR